MSPSSSYRVRLSTHCARVRCEPEWHLGPAWASRLTDFDLWFVWAGRGRMVTDRGEFVLQPGVCVWMRPGGAYTASHDPAAPLGVNFIHFELEGSAPAPVPGFEVMQTAHLDFVDAVMQRILALRREGTPTATESAERLMAGLLAELERENRETVGGSEGEASERHHRQVVEALVAKIRENPGQSVRVDELARQAGYSVDHFSRVFQRVTGQRPQAYLIATRLTRARQLLAETGLTVGEVANLLGFSDVFFFSRQFREKCGCTPTEYRTRLGRRGKREE